MALDTGAQRSRRAVLAGALGGLGAAALQALGKPAAALAASNGNVQLGHGTADTDNDAAAETRINGTTDGQTVFSAYQNGGGTGLLGHTSGGIAIKGVADSGVGGQITSGTGMGLYAQSGTSTGLKSKSTDNTPSDFASPSNKTGLIGLAGGDDNIATNTDETGVYGYSDVSPNSVGVVGQSHQGVGALGIGAIGVEGIGTWAILGDVAPDQIGVYGNTGADPAPIVSTGVGVLARAQSTAQLALRVLGRVSFSRSGRTSLSTGTSSKAITMAGVTTSSYILATLQTNRAGFYVQAVVPASGKFTIYLNKAVPGTTYVGYMVIN